MPGASFRARLGPTPHVPDDATTTVIDADITWPLPSGVPFRYRTEVELRLTDDLR